MNNLVSSKGNTQKGLDLVLYSSTTCLLPLDFSSLPKKALHTQVKCEILETLFSSYFMCLLCDSAKSLRFMLPSPY